VDTIRADEADTDGDTAYRGVKEYVNVEVADFVGSCFVRFIRCLSAICLLDARDGCIKNGCCRKENDGFVDAVVLDKPLST
jgi:hypothetical protein